MAEDTFSMRQDAVRRMREMYSRARPQPQTQSQAQPQQNRHTPREEPKQEEKQEAVHIPEQEKSPDLFETFFKDKEKMLILALLVILSQENTDNSLLFALMFLLL